jgi:hypothetical protein
VTIVRKPLTAMSPSTVPGSCGSGAKVIPSVERRIRGGGTGPLKPVPAWLPRELTPDT